MRPGSRLVRQRLLASLVFVLSMTYTSTLDAATKDVLSEEEARIRAARVTNISYDLDFSFLEDARGYEAQTLVHFDYLGGEGDLRLDLRATELRELQINGETLEAPEYSGVAITLPARLLKKGKNTVRVEFANEYERSGNGLHHFRDSMDRSEYLYTSFEPFYAHRLFPCFDQPDLKAIYRLQVTAPADWEIISNDPLLSVRPAGKSLRRHTFVPTKLLSTYLFFLGAGPFAVWTDREARIPAKLYARKSMAAYVPVDHFFELTRKGLNFFQEYFGYEYPFRKYDQIFCPEFNFGAMENPGAVTFSERYLYRHEPEASELESRADTLIHEMAHMWFGDLVTMRWWDGLWLNESFATYMSQLALTEAAGYPGAFESFLSSEKSWAYWQDQLPSTHPVAGEVEDTGEAFSNFDGITYGKGASLLKQLAYYIGPENFRRGVQAYFKRHAWRNTDLSDFFDALGEFTERDLNRWTQVHLVSSGVNIIEPVIEVKDGRTTSVKVVQSPGNGDSLIRPRRLQVAFYSRDESGRLVRSEVASVSLDGKSASVPKLVGVSAPDFAFANHGDHAYAKVFLDPRSLEFVQSHIEEIPDSLTRRAVWITLWHMLRDQAMSPQAYLDIVLAKAPLEPDSKLVRSLVRGVAQVLRSYLPGDLRQEYLQRVQQVSWQQLQEAPTGGDLQKIWFSLLARSASGKDALTRLAGFLDGRTKIDGLEIDPEKRWTVVRRLAAGGYPGARTLVASELKRDSTDIGRREAMQAEASLPEARAKEAFWRRFIADTQTSLDRMRAAMRGFHQPDQAELTKGYVQAYFDAIPMQVEKRETDFAHLFVEALYPSYSFDLPVVEATRKFLDEHPEMPSEVRRALIEAEDEFRRALEIRRLAASS